jgi:lipopolysaccharide transport system ATP-binding protein
MTNETVIRVENLAKRYRVGVRAQTSDTLAGSLMGMVRQPLRNLRNLRRLSQFGDDAERADAIWALRDVSFEVSQGEVLGVIGRNGAGKSTLLKVLSRITEPSSGRVQFKGRVASLIEVGTGFHKELTGRENVYLNGTILGMSRREVDSRFEEIVEFSGVQKYIDTPVKWYSSGMYMRLAFAVAAHLETDILLLDEVLAVGDIAFQRKCLGKMHDVAESGRTVLFVSHNMSAISSLCQRVIVLDSGRIVEDGTPTVAIQRYNEALAAPSLVDRHRSVEFSNIKIGSNNNTIAAREPLIVTCTLYLQHTLDWFALYCTIQDSGNSIVAMCRQNSPDLPYDGGVGAFLITLELPPLWLRPDVYNLQFKLMSNALELGKTRFVSDSVSFNVTGDASPELLKGYLVPQVNWSMDLTA